MERFTAVCREMFEFGLEKHHERQREIKLFLEAIEDAKRDNKQQASAKIDEFMAYKHKVNNSRHSPLP
jgi:hemerythrin superfamily protein